MKLHPTKTRQAAYLLLLAFGLVPFQNCNKVHFSPTSTPSQKTETPVITTGNPENPGGPVIPTNPPEVCGGISCELTPLTSKPTVTTILLALGDKVDTQFVINTASSQLIAESVVRYSSPKTNPKILLVRDFGAEWEDPEDTTYIRNLLVRYNVSYIELSDYGLSPSQAQGYDVIWFNNPGKPMHSTRTRSTLMQFTGAIVLQGDDLAHGTDDFSLEDLTGLHFIGNGTDVLCDDGNYYKHDDNDVGGQRYWVTLDKTKISAASNSQINFRYGNDIDETTVSNSKVDVLAWAKGGPDSCKKLRPAITRIVR